MTTLSIYRAFVVRALRPRERKHTVMIYSTVAPDAETARERVQTMLNERSEAHCMEIAQVHRFANLDAVLADGCFFRTPTEVASWKHKEQGE